MADAPSILALDLATKTGWAFATADAVAAWPVGAMFAREVPVISSGVVQLKGTQQQKCGQMLKWVIDTLHELRPGQIWVEAVIANPGAPKTFREQKRRSSINRAAQLAHGLHGVVKAFCETKELPIYERFPNQIKRSLTGHGNADKAAMIRMCELRGWHPSDDNEADAMALLDLAAVHWRTGRKVA